MKMKDCEFVSLVSVRRIAQRVSARSRNERLKRKRRKEKVVWVASLK